MHTRTNKEGGFSLAMVMVAAVCLGILATIFVRQIGNQLDIVKLAAAISYRNTLLDYYHSITANRHSYTCTKQNSSALKNYVEGISSTLTRQAITVYGVRNPCAVFIPSTGLGFNIGDEYPASSPTSSPCSGRPFCLKPAVRATGNGNEVEIILTLSFTPANADGVGMEIKDVSRSLFYNLTIQKNCSTSLGEKAAIQVVFDKKDKVNEGVKCSAHTLIAPPKKGALHVAQCPLTSAGGKTAVVRFNPTTGLTQCSTGIVLSAAGGGNPVTGVAGSGYLEMTTTHAGVLPSSCGGADDAATGVSAGIISGCMTIPVGPQGPSGEDGHEIEYFLGICRLSGAACESSYDCPNSNDWCSRSNSCGLVCYSFKGSS